VSETTKIAWADSTAGSVPEPLSALKFSDVADTVSLEVRGIVAWIAQRQTVGNFKAQVWKCSERFNVVGAKIAAAFISALLTDEFVAFKYKPSPLSLTRVAPIVEISGGSASFPMNTFFSAWIKSASILAHLAFGFFRQFFSETTLIPLIRSRNFCFSLWSVMASLERGRQTLSIHANLYAATDEARRINSVSASPVFSKLRNQLPGFASGATLLSRINQRFELLKSKASLSSGQFHCA
jgi:hypothetical protein